MGDLWQKQHVPPEVYRRAKRARFCCNHEIREVLRMLTSYNGHYLSTLHTQHKDDVG